MDGNDLLQILAQSSSGDSDLEKMPPRAIRFALEYAQPPSVEIEKRKISTLIPTAAYSLAPFEKSDSARLACFLVLQFTGVERTLSERALYEIANVLRNALGLVSCEPDVGARIYFEPDARNLDPTRAESAVVDLWCWSNAAAPGDKRWALESIRAPGAWRLSPKKGEGVLIGQPDTGIATHPELETGVFALDKAKNILEGGANPTDPLSASVANPGHGTATSSVVISREDGVMAGSAPLARIAPIRCVDDVKIFDGAPVAAAVNHARNVGCDIVTMSLGGIYSSALAAAVADAVDAGMIMLAAAGNCVGFVVYPASDPNVIAVAGVDANDTPWKGTCAGSAVDIAAPAENVYVARRTPDDGGRAEVSGGQGTSFAVALTAGAAALWLAHHGRDAVRAEARRRKSTVQTLFRNALRATARRPADWDSAWYGAGVVDAEALLNLSLGDTPRGDKPRPTEVGKLEKISRLAVERVVVDGFDWARHGAEASLLAADAAIMSRRSQAGIEAIGTGVLRPSAEVEQAAPAILRSLFGSADMATVAARVDRSSTRNERLITIIGRGAGGGAESAASVTVEAAQRNLKGAHSRMLVDKLDKALSGLPAEDSATEAERKRVIDAAEVGIRRLAVEGVAARLTVHERIGIEALISIHDRPALRVRDSRINPDDPLLGDWGGGLLPVEHLLKPVLESLGRIDLDGIHIGTGFVVAPGRIMTNRHVLEAIAEEFHQTNGSRRWVFTGAATINFADDGRGEAKRFKIQRVIAAGPDRINEIVDFAHLDMAVLEVETTNETGALPGILPLISDAEFAAGRSEILVAGYPARPGLSALRDPDSGLIRDDVSARLGKIFGLAYSVKYLSPGEIDYPVGQLKGDGRGWIFAHDATTLGGNSGSWAMHLGDPFGVIGLHFGGGTLRANYAHGLVAVKNSGVLAPAGLEGAIWT